MYCKHCGKEIADDSLDGEVGDNSLCWLRGIYVHLNNISALGQEFPILI